MNRFIFLVSMVLLFGAGPSSSQPFAIGNWREHMPYLDGKAVAVAADRVYCATDNGLFAYQRSDQSLKRFSRLSGLNDFGIQTISYSSQYKILIIAYSNANIDLLYDDDKMINLSDIKRKNIPGNKVINRITIDGRYVYFSCGFGIVVLDLERKEIKDTYYISNASSSPDIQDVTNDATFLYAAADDGVYRAALNDPFISNYTAWTKILGDTANAGQFNHAAYFNNTLFVNYNRTNNDTVMAYNGSWGTALPVELLTPDRKLNYHVANGKFYVAETSGISVYDNSLTRIRLVDAAQVPAPVFSDGIEDVANDMWIADQSRGLLRVNGAGYEKYLPEGPNSPRCAAMQVVDGTLWVIHGPRSRAWLNEYKYDGFSTFNGSDWVTYDGKTANTQLFFQYNFYDNMTLVVDPGNKNKAFIGSGGGGLLLFENGNPVIRYDSTNSTLEGQIGNTAQCKVHGITLDRDKNLWVSNAGVRNVINVLKNNGTWKDFYFPGAVNSQAKTGDMIIDNNGFLWLIVFENIGGKEGLLVFNPNNTIDNTGDDQFDIVDFNTNRLRCLAIDKDGTIWLGSEAGIYVFYPPSIVPQQILIRQDNTNQYLLSAAAVTAIAVDGANRKWVGTESGGLYLFSSDGQQQIHHFTVENSPLFSNNITALTIDGKSGEVWIGTDKGLMSYQSDALEADELIPGCKDLLVYPNPVKSEYDGPIAVKGVVPNGIIKITDVNGGLVYQTTALGTQAIWNGRNLQGEKVSSGVYIVFSSDATGENTCVTKLMYFR